MCFVFAEQFHAGANLFESDGTYSEKLDIYSNLLIQEDPVRANVFCRVRTDTSADFTLCRSALLTAAGVGDGDVRVATPPD